MNLLGSKHRYTEITFSAELLTCGVRLAMDTVSHTSIGISYLHCPGSKTSSVAPQLAPYLRQLTLTKRPLPLQTMFPQVISEQIAARLLRTVGGSDRENWKRYENEQRKRERREQNGNNETEKNKKESVRGKETET